MFAPVFLYHKIDCPTPDIRVRGGFTPPSRFAKQMAYLKRRDFVFYTASELIGYFLEHGRFPPKGIAITFDDGWRDNYTHAFPILQRFGIKATIFIIPSCIDQISSKAVAEGEDARAHLTRSEIREMSQYGIEFGSHSMNHKLFHQLSPSEVKFDVEESKKKIEELLEKTCQVFAYPAGFFTVEAQQAIRDAGYISAFTTTYGATQHLDLFAINRIEILRRDRFMFQFARKLVPVSVPPGSA